MGNSVLIDRDTRTRFSRLLANPWVDRSIAIIACLPAGYLAYQRIRAGNFDIVRLNLIIPALLLIVTMVSRRPPQRVTPNPWFWLLAFLATYWVPFTALVAPAGALVAPRWLVLTLSWLGLGTAVYARLSLGRNIGFVPAQRQLVTTGAYGLVRHPIYTALSINYLSLVLQRFTSITLFLAALGVGWFIVKSIVEEHFLRTDPEYAAYMRRVRWRWIPGVV
jgi:protein-S-isoprenylcysteine O-methyltransferase Ste14